MSLPAPVQDYLMSLLAQRQAPLTAEVDSEWRLLSLHGDEQLLGELTIGSDLRDALPFLHGQDAFDCFVLPMMNLDAERVFNIHGVPGDDRAYVLFLPADEEHNARRDLQQKANEVRLLNHRQKRLVEQLSVAKAALEARERDLVRANDIKARFIAGISHEFRTPLTAILGYAELIEEGTSAASETSEVDAHIRSVSRAARHLLSMVDNILDQARLEDGQVVLNPQPIVLRDLVDDLTATLAPLAAARFLGFAAFVDPAVPTTVRTDGTRIRQILLNLLGNAIKFTEEGDVRLDIGWDDGTLTCTVTDTGPGIAEEDQQSIFDAFSRGRGSDQVRGVGLGLNITQRLCGLLGGRVELE
ncbi:MAG: ATP-binding protein, partial [Pseudomonadota bacterium]